MSWIATGVGVASAAAPVIMGAVQSHKAKKALQNLQGQAMPQYTMSPEYTDYYNQARNQAQFGYSPEQTAAFQQNVAQQQNTGFRQGVQMGGGNMAQALNAGLASQNLNAQNQFASQGAALQQQKMGAYGQAAGQMQDQQNLINQQKINYRMMLENAYGTAHKAGQENIVNGIQNGLGLGVQAYGAGFGQKKVAPTQQPAGSGYQLDPSSMQGIGPGVGYAAPNEYNPYTPTQGFNMAPSQGLGAGYGFVKPI